MLQKYQNELIVLFVFLLLTSAIVFKVYQEKQLEVTSIDARQQIAKMQDIATMKKIWEKNKTIFKRLSAIKKSLRKETIERFKLDKRKADIVLINLNGSELNRVVGKHIASVAVQIIELSVARSGDKYRLEIQCKW